MKTASGNIQNEALDSKRTGAVDNVFQCRDLCPPNSLFSVIESTLAGSPVSVGTGFNSEYAKMDERCLPS